MDSCFFPSIESLNLTTFMTKVSILNSLGFFLKTSNWQNTQREEWIAAGSKSAVLRKTILLNQKKNMPTKMLFSATWVYKDPTVLICRHEVEFTFALNQQGFLGQKRLHHRWSRSFLLVKSTGSFWSMDRFFLINNDTHMLFSRYVLLFFLLIICCFFFFLLSFGIPNLKYWSVVQHDGLFDEAGNLKRRIWRWWTPHQSSIVRPPGTFPRCDVTSKGVDIWKVLSFNQVSLKKARDFHVWPCFNSGNSTT